MNSLLCLLALSRPLLPSASDPKWADWVQVGGADTKYYVSFRKGNNDFLERGMVIMRERNDRDVKLRGELAFDVVNTATNESATCRTSVYIHPNQLLTDPGSHWSIPGKGVAEDPKVFAATSWAVRNIHFTHVQMAIPSDPEGTTYEVYPTSNEYADALKRASGSAGSGSGAGGATEGKTSKPGGTLEDPAIRAAELKRQQEAAATEAEQRRQAVIEKLKEGQAKLDKYREADLNRFRLEAFQKQSEEEIDQVLDARLEELDAMYPEDSPFPKVNLLRAQIRAQLTMAATNWAQQAKAEAQANIYKAQSSDPGSGVVYAFANLLYTSKSAALQDAVTRAMGKAKDLQRQLSVAESEGLDNAAKQDILLPSPQAAARPITASISLRPGSYDYAVSTISIDMVANSPTQKQFDGIASFVVGDKFIMGTGPTLVDGKPTQGRGLEGTATITGKYSFGHDSSGLMGPHSKKYQETVAFPSPMRFGSDYYGQGLGFMDRWARGALTDWSVKNNRETWGLIEEPFYFQPSVYKIGQIENSVEHADGKQIWRIQRCISEVNGRLVNCFRIVGTQNITSSSPQYTSRGRIEYLIDEDDSLLISATFQSNSRSSSPQFMLSYTSFELKSAKPTVDASSLTQLMDDVAKDPMPVHHAEQELRSAARVRYARWLFQVSPSDKRALREVLRSDLQNSDWNAALADLDSAETGGIQKNLLQIARAYALRSAGKTAAALTALAEVSAQTLCLSVEDFGGPAVADLQWRKDVLKSGTEDLLAKGDVEGAAKLAALAYAAWPGEGWSQDLTYAVAETEGKEQREAAVEKLGSSADASVKWKVALAKQRLAKGNAGAARELLAKTGDADASNPQVLELQGDLSFSDGKFADAEGFYSKALAAETSPALTIKLAKAMAGEKKYEEASSLYSRVAGGDPDNADALVGMAKAELALKRNDSALAALMRAEPLRPDDTSLRILLGNLYLQSQKPSEAERSFRSALLLGDKGVEPLWGLGRAAAATKKYAIAAEAFRQAHVKSPSDGAICLQLASVLAKEGDGVGAKAMLQMANRLGADDPQIKADVKAAAPGNAAKAGTTKAPAKSRKKGG